MLKTFPAKKLFEIRHMHHQNNNMQITNIPFSHVPQFSQKDKDYALEASYLQPFFKHGVKIESFPNIIEAKQKKSVNRTTLVQALQTQYEGIDTNPLVRENMMALAQDNTFTITTAHQPALFTGPLYYIYKIISVIHLTRQLNQKYTDYHFVPVFVSGAEDHDFDEINHAHIFGKTYQWQQSQEGATGTMDIDGLSTVLSELETVLGTGENAGTLRKILRTAYLGHHNYGKAAFLLANALFQQYGLVVVDMNTPILKRTFTPYILDELMDQVSLNIVPKTQEALEERGFARQTHVRDINLFYLFNQQRNRIEFKDGTYHILNSDLSFTPKEMQELVKKHPERFSPNVVMRPIYQELVLPNLAYVGGGGEIAYWLERKTQFEHWDIPFPMLIRRNSVLWISKAESKKMDKLGLNIEQLFDPVDTIIKNYVTAHADEAFDLEKEKEKIQEIFESIRVKALKVDQGLGKLILAEQSKQIKAINNLEGRLHKAEKQKHEVALNQIKNLKEKLFPKNGLQERYDNFIPFFLKYGWQYFDILLKELDPLQKGLIIIKET